MRAPRRLVPLLMAMLVLPTMIASANVKQITERVVQQGLQMHEQMRQADPAAVLLIDSAGRHNLAETNLNWAAALLTASVQVDLAQRVIAQSLQHQDREAGSATRGLFRWYAESGEQYSSDATLYIAPTVAYLSGATGVGELRGDLRQSARLALDGLLAMPDRPRYGYGGAMWAGAVLSLADRLGDADAAQEGVRALVSTTDALRRNGLGGVHSPTFDALRIGGLRWAWEHSPDEQSRNVAEAALGICYADMLQRYDATTAMVTGAIGHAYASDYLGQSGIARYLLACDLDSALELAQSVTPLGMYFALTGYSPHEELLALAQSSDAREVRTRTPDPAGEAPELWSTCTWTAGGMSLGTMSGPVTGASIPLLATCDLPKRPTSYFYVYGGQATVHSAQFGPLALASFDFDEVGMGRRIQVGVRGVLGRRDQIDRVVIGVEDWIGEPRAVGQNVAIALQRGSSYLGIKILQTGPAGAAPPATKPGRIEWFAEGNMDSLLLTVAGRAATYPLPAPLHDVRVGLLVEVAHGDDFGSLDEFAAHLASRRVSQSLEEEKRRVETEEARQIPGRHEIRPIAEMRFARFLFHEMSLERSEQPLGLVQELLRNRLQSRTLPVELPDNYLWVSPALTLTTGGAAAASGDSQ